MSHHVNPQKYRPKCFERYDERCQICQSEGNIEVHHIDADRTNNDIDNLIPLCMSCHVQIHKENCLIDGMVVRELRERMPDSAKETPKPPSSDTEYESVRVRLTKQQTDWFDENPSIKFHEFVRDAVQERMELHTDWP